MPGMEPAEDLAALEQAVRRATAAAAHGQSPEGELVQDWDAADPSEWGHMGVAPD